MTITIEDISEKYRQDFLNKKIVNICIDYQTNCIHGYLGDKDVVLYDFSKRGVRMDNRKGPNKLTHNQKGIRVITT